MPPKCHSGQVERHDDLTHTGLDRALEGGRLDEAIEGLDSAHAAYWVGYDLGYAKGQMDASELLAIEWLHRLAVEYTRAAVDSAQARHGAGWADLVRAQAEAAA